MAKKIVAEATGFGPKMMALNERRRRFVVALFDEGMPRKGAGLFLFAAKAAGYGRGSRNALKVQASRVAHDPAVQEAIVEHSRRVMRAIPPEAIGALRDLIRDPQSPHHFRAISAVIDRTDPVETQHTVRVEDWRPPSEAVTQRVLDRIEELMARAGLPAAGAAPKVIEGEFKAIEAPNE